MPKTIRERFWWPGTIDMAKKIVAACAPCQQMCRELTEPRTSTSIPVFHIFHRWHVDLVGPLPTSARGHKYVIVAVEAATKWIEAECIMAKTAEIVKNWIWSEIICRFGCPKEIVTDNGFEFTKDLDFMFEECGIEHKRTAPHHPRANGAVEKVNDVLELALSKVVNESRTDWDLRLPKILLSARKAEHHSTRMSPAKALMNKTLELPGMVMIDVVIPDRDPPIILNEATTPASQQAMDRLEEVVLTNVAQAHREQSMKYARRHSRRSHVTERALPKPGDYIMIKEHKNGKLQPIYEKVVYQLKAWNSTKTTATVEDALGKSWIENATAHQILCTRRACRGHFRPGSSRGAQGGVESQSLAIGSPGITAVLEDELDLSWGYVTAVT